MTAHAFAESVRLVSLWAGAARSGSFSRWALFFKGTRGVFEGGS